MCPRPRKRRIRPPPPLPLPPLPYWPSEDEKRAALACQKNLQDGISKTLNEMTSGRIDTVTVDSSLRSALDQVNGLGSFFSLYLEPRFYNEHRPDDCTAAQRTFDVPELLEMILEHVGVPDVLSMYQVNHSIRDSIEYSSKMQTKLCLRAVPAHSFFETPLNGCLVKYFDCELSPTACFPPSTIGRGFSCSIQSFPVLPFNQNRDSEDDTQNRTVTMNAYFYPFKQQRLPGFGSRIRRMFICQPPVKKMTVQLSCCPSPYIYSEPPPPAPELITSEVGLTVGDLYDCAERLMDEHRWCPYAHAGQLDDDGMVDNAVQFQASVVLSPDDPMILSMREMDANNDVDSKRRDMRRAKLTVYTNAKKQATSNQERVPTFPEFEATYPEDTDWIALAYPRPTPPMPQPFTYHPPIAPALPMSSSSAASVDTASVTVDDPLATFDFDSFLNQAQQDDSSGSITTATN